MYNLLIITPEEVLFKGQVDTAVFPGSEGSFEILTDHAPIISQLKEGVVTINNHTKIQISKGFLEFSNNNCTVLTD